MPTKKAAPASAFITPDALLAHWQGHRALTRRVIDAFPADQLYSFSLGDMRPFGEMANELLAIGSPMLQGLLTGEWKEYAPEAVDSKPALLKRWDECTEEIDDLWRRLPGDGFAETVTTFGLFTGPMHWQILYAVDNEIHHRGQGYVYLRALGVEPPVFYER
jgi:uncharacterized damage-inducible protein DinB